MTSRRRKPRIGVTGPNKGGLAAWLFTWLAVRRAGGAACRITPANPCDPESLDGLVLGGGSDVDPEHYGQELLQVEEEFEQQQRRGFFRRAATFPLFLVILLVRFILAVHHGPKRDPGRDELEFFLARRALERGIPVLGICRGAQLLNVVHNGDLYQTLDDFYQEVPNVRSVFPKKCAKVVDGSLLASILGPGEHRINALHNQAVYCLGHNMRVSATEVPTGVVQAVEDIDKTFVLGVQWHPEFLPQVAKQQRIFRRLVAEAASYEQA